MPLRRPHVGALHVVLVNSRPDHFGIDLLQIENLLRIGSIVCGNFGGASLEAIQTRKKLAELTAVTSAPEGAEPGVSTAHIFVDMQLLEVRRVIVLTVTFEFSFCNLVAGRIKEGTAISKAPSGNLCVAQFWPSSHFHRVGSRLFA